MFCRHCGLKLSQDARFCISCGTEALTLQDMLGASQGEQPPDAALSAAHGAEETAAPWGGDTEAALPQDGEGLPPQPEGESHTPKMPEPFPVAVGKVNPSAVPEEITPGGEQPEAPGEEQPGALSEAASREQPVPGEGAPAALEGDDLDDILLEDDELFEKSLAEWQKANGVTRREEERKFAPPPPPFIPQEEAEKQKSSAPPPQARPRKKPAAGKVLLGLLLAVLVLAGIAGGIYYFGLQGYYALPAWVPVPSTSDGAEGEPGSPTEGAQGGEGSSGTLRATPAEPSGQLAESWPPYPHVSDIYHFAREDDTHVYFLPPYNEAGTPQQIYQMEKNGANLQIVVDLSFSDKNLEALGAQWVETFTIMEEYIYFSSGLGEGRSAYYRVPKTGGDIEFLFLQERSCITPYGGKLYFLFPEQKLMGVYEPSADVLPLTVPLADIPDTASLLHQFSVVDGMLYYGLYSGNLSDYYRMDVETGEAEPVLSGKELGDSIVRPIWVGEDVFYVQHQSNGIDVWYRLSEGEEEPEKIFQGSGADNQIMSVARIGDYFLFQIANSYYWSPVDNPTDSSVKVNSGWQPFAVSGSWIFFPDKLVAVEERANPVMVADAGVGLLGGYDEAFLIAADLHDMTPDAYAAAPAGAIPAGSGLPKVANTPVPAGNLAEVLAEDDTRPFLMAAWALSSTGAGSAAGQDLMQGMSYLFAADDTVDLAEVNGGKIPVLLSKALAGELFGVEPESMYGRVGGGLVPGMALLDGGLQFVGWDMGGSPLIGLELVQRPTPQGDGTHMAVVEGQNADGTKTTWTILCVENEGYTVFPYRLTSVTRS